MARVAKVLDCFGHSRPIEYSVDEFCRSTSTVVAGEFGVMTSRKHFQSQWPIREVKALLEVGEAIGECELTNPLSVQLRLVKLVMSEGLLHTI